MPQACTLIRTEAGPASGMGRSTSWRGPPGRVTWTARMFMIGMMSPGRLARRSDDTHVPKFGNFRFSVDIAVGFRPRRVSHHAGCKLCAAPYALLWESPSASGAALRLTRRACRWTRRLPREKALRVVSARPGAGELIEVSVLAEPGDEFSQPLAQARLGPIP